MRDGSVVIFGPGTGITDGRKLSAQPSSDLLGIPLELVDKSASRSVLVHAGTHDALADLRGPMVYGDSYAYGPVLQPMPDLKGAIELGKASIFFNSNRSGLVLREFGHSAKGRGPTDCAAVFSVACPLPAELLRSLALYAGCNPWGDLGDVVAASGSMLAVHTVRPGMRRIHLPSRADRHGGANRTGRRAASPSSKPKCCHPIPASSCSTDSTSRARPQSRNSRC